MLDKPEVIVALSGGMDSATVLAFCCERFGADHVEAVAVDYGQTHMREVRSAVKLAQHFRIADFSVKELDFKSFTESSILNPAKELNDAFSHSPEKSTVAPSWLPARNALILSAMAAYAYCRGAKVIATGVNAIDWSGYPDCTPAFIEALQAALRLGLATMVGQQQLPYPLEIYTPIIEFSKREIVEAGETLHVPWELTWSCYKGETLPCGECGACKVRKIGFDEAGIKDPLEVR